MSVLAGLLVLGNLGLTLAALISPDSCGEISRSGDGDLVIAFLGVAAVSAVATMGTWFTARSTRRTARYVVSFIAVGLPVIDDLIALSSTPGWLI